MLLFFYGSDTFTLAREIKALKAKFAADNPSAAVEDFRLSNDQNPGELLNSLAEVLQNQGLFAEKKLVILRNFLGEIKDYPKIEEYLMNFLKTGSGPDIIFDQTEKFDRRLKFFKNLQKQATSKEFLVPEGRELETWAENYLKNAGFAIEREALSEFVRRMSGENQEENLYDLWQVSSELEKLMQLQHEEKSISLSAVRDVVRPNITQNIFALTNLFAEGRSSEAQRLLEQLVGYGPASELKSQTIQIIGGLASQIRSLLLVKDFGTQSSSVIAQKLGWKEGRVWINSKLARNFTKEKLASLLRDLRALDLRLKTSEEPPKLLLSLFLLRSQSQSPATLGSGQKARS